MFRRLPIDPELANIMQGGMPDSSVHRTKHPTKGSWYRPHLDVSLQLIDEAARNRDARIIDVGGGESLGGAFLMGATSGLVAAPCGAPAFAAVLTWVAGSQSAVWGFTYLFVFSLGMTALLVVVGLAAGTAAALPRAGAWMVWIKRLSGCLMLAMAEYYFIKMGQVL